MSQSQDSKIPRFVEIVVSLIAIASFVFVYISQNNQIVDLNSQVRELDTQLQDEEKTNERLFALLVAKTSDGAISPTDLAQFLSPAQVDTIVQQAGIDIKATLPFNLDTQFVPSGWMGDGEQGLSHLSVNNVMVNVNGTDKVAAQIEYRPGDKKWAGIYWLYPDKNWGDKPGKSLVGAGKITFWAKGEKGGEIVEFKSGGIRGKYSDTLEVSSGKIALSSTWQEYTLDLASQDLSNVIGAFAWIAAAPDNKGEDVTIYIADLVIDK